MHGGFGLGMGWMWIWPVLLIVAALVVIRALLGAQRPPGGEKTPEEVLRDRLARGEIDEQEYSRRRELLRK